MRDSRDRVPVQDAAAWRLWQCEAIPWAGDLQHALVAIWRSLLATMDRPAVYQYPEWLALAHQAGLARCWRVLVVTHDGRPVGLMPLARPTRWTAGVLTAMTLEHAPLLYAPGAGAGTWAAVARWFRDASGLPALTVGREEDARARWICDAVDDVVTVRHPVPPGQVVPVPDTWEAYLGQLGAGTRKGIRRAMRQFLEETPGAAFEVLTDPVDCAVMLETLIALHRRHWRDSPTGSFFEDRQAVQFYRQAVPWAARQGMAAIFVLRQGSVPFIAHTAFFAPGSDTMQSHIIARDQTVQVPGCHSPGLVLNALTVRWAMEHGYRYLDLGLGDNGAKAQVGAQSRPLTRVILAQSPAQAALCQRIEAALGHADRLARRLRQLWSRGASLPG